MSEDVLVERLNQTGRGEALLALIDKLGFKRAFVADAILSATGPLTVSQVAMLWQGMPNKHDRKRVKQLFDAFVEAGLLAAADDAGETFNLS